MAEDPKPEVFGTMQLPPGVDPRELIAAPITEADLTIRPEPGAAVPVGEPPAIAPPLGQARYALGDEIARGGMGRVVDAVDLVLGRTVAFKEALSTDPDAVRRFARETRITARLEHPSIVPVHDAGVSATGQPFYVMRKIGGQPLEKLVGEAHSLPQRLALIPHIVASARAIAHAHERGIVHRDIKPSNILAGELGETIVIDWGLAKVIGEADELADAAAAARLGAEPLHTRVGVVFGTPGFMSPEQLRGAPVDEQCDVYALGATLYHLLARRPPHYAKTADEMMRNAAASPPTPVSELVEGVPPELETIVGKALAQTAEARYPTSRALAEDLQRFLTGQLVAAHRYSRRDRLRRFARLHKIELAIAAAAVAILIVVSSVLVHRIVAERDRADAEAREARHEKQLADEQRNAANERADQLALDRARALVGTNPTAAVAQLGPLGSSPRWWTQVRAIGAAARAAGVATTLPASAETIGLELAHDGTHLLAVGADGVIRLHDLAARTTRVLATTSHATLAHLTGDDRRVVVAAGAHLVIVDAAGAAPPRELDAAAPITALAVAGDRAYWVDAAHAGWALDLAAAAPPVALAAPEPLRDLRPSPDGAWLALIGATHLFVTSAEPGGGEAAPQSLATGDVRALAWAADSRGFAALAGDDVWIFAIGEPSEMIARLAVGQRADVAMIGDNTYVVGPTGVALASRDGLAPRKQLAGYALGLRAGPRGVIIAGSAQGTLAVLSAAGDPVLAAPSGGLTAFASAPQSPYVAAAGDGGVLVWDLTTVLPRRITGTAPAAAELVDDDHVLATYPSRPAEWIDLAHDTSGEIGDLPGVTQIAPALDGASAAVTDLAHALQVVAPGQAPVAIAGDVARVAFVGPGRLAIADAAALRIHDVASGRDAPIPAAGAPRLLAHAGAWLAASDAAGHVVRLDTAATAPASDVASATAGPSALAIDATGVVVIGTGTAVRVWRAGAAQSEPLLELPRPIRELHLVTGGRAIALADTTAYALDLASHTVLATIAVGGAAAVADDAGLVVVRSSAGVLEVVDAFAGPRDGVRWTLASATDVVFGAPHVTRDGHRVLASTPSGLVVWTLDLPATPAATGAWLHRLAGGAGP